ncbi:hypothetical protein FDECE_11632 [Fusarium decemcellulare]|nr:hypothetical protein FDECE_11632 [Fusarium decemcellulare]
MRVAIEDHDPTWRAQFLDVREQLLRDLQDVPIVSIEHVGSTAIPGLKAKPVLDIDVIVTASSLKAARNAMVKAGYTDCGEMDIPGRYIMRQPGYGQHDAAHGRGHDGEMRRNTYIMVEGYASLRNHLDVRRVLLGNAELREEYGRLKAGLIGKDFNDIGEYVRCKSEVLVKILRAAGWSEEDLQPVINANSR